LPEHEALYLDDIETGFGQGYAHNLELLRSTRFGYREGTAARGALQDGSLPRGGGKLMEPCYDRRIRVVGRLMNTALHLGGHGRLSRLAGPTFRDGLAAVVLPVTLSRLPRLVSSRQPGLYLSLDIAHRDGKDGLPARFHNSETIGKFGKGRVRVGPDRKGKPVRVRQRTSRYVPQACRDVHVQETLLGERPPKCQI